LCAAGLHGSNADGRAKEVAIYRATRRLRIVIADDDGVALRDGFGRDDLGPVRAPALSFVLCALAGHRSARKLPSRSTRRPARCEPPRGLHSKR